MTSAPCALALGSLLLASLVLPAAVFGQPADEDQVWSIWKGNARVKR